MKPYAQSADTYLTNRVQNAGPELQAALLMEAGQLFLGRAIKAIEKSDHNETARCLRRSTEILNEAILRLNYEDGGELVENLAKVYDWWTLEIFESSSTKDTARLQAVSASMGEIREAWEQLHEKQSRGLQNAEFQTGGQII